MPMNHDQIRMEIDPLYSAIAQEYAPNEFNAGAALFPDVQVFSRSGKIPFWGKEAFMVEDTERAPGTITKRTGLVYSSKTFALIDHAMDAVVAIEDMEEANAVPGIDLAAPNINLTQHKIMLSLEKEKADLSTSVSAYPAGHTATLAGTDRWDDYANSDPQADVEAGINAIEDAEGVTPNTCVMSVKTYRVLKKHPKVIAYVKGIGVEVTKINTRHIAEYLDVDEVTVTKARFTAADGTFQYFWGADVVLAYVNKNPTSNKIRSYGYTFKNKGYPFVKAPWFDKTCDSWIYGTKDCRKPYMTANACGYLLKDVITIS